MRVTKEEYEKKDYYERINLVLSICGSVNRGLASVGNHFMAREYINYLMDILETHHALFSEDPEINDTKDVRIQFDDLKEIIPLIRKDEADFSFLIQMLDYLERAMEERLPKNVRLARFFDSLISHKEDIATTCGIDIETLADVFDKMKNNTDAIDKVLTDKNKKNK